MILKNESPKGKYFTVHAEGYPQKVWIGAYSEYNLANISNKFDGDSITTQSKKVTSTGSSSKRNYIFLKGNNYSLYSNIQKGKQYIESDSRKLYEGDFVGKKPSSPATTIYYITFELNSLLDFLIENGISNTLSDWNTFFDTTTNADTPFTSLDGAGNTVTLGGATNLTIKDGLFQIDSRGGALVD